MLCFDSEVQDQLKYIINLGRVQQTLWEYENLILLSLVTSEHLSIISPEDWILLKTWRKGS